MRNPDEQMAMVAAANRYNSTKNHHGQTERNAFWKGWNEHAAYLVAHANAPDENFQLGYEAAQADAPRPVAEQVSALASPEQFEARYGVTVDGKRRCACGRLNVAGSVSCSNCGIGVSAGPSLTSAGV